VAEESRHPSRKSGGLRVPSDNVPRRTEEQLATATEAQSAVIGADEAEPGDSVEIAFDEDEVGDANEPSPPKGKWPRVVTESISDTELESMVIESADSNRRTLLDVPAVEDSAPEESTHERATVPIKAIKVATAEDGEESDSAGELLADDIVEEMDEDGASGSKPRAASKSPPPAPSKPAGKEPKRAAGPKPWFEEIFNEDYLRTLPFLTPQATQFEANFVIESLNLEPGADVLDVACGYGRHAMELAARGYQVVGLDASLPLLLRGADEAQRRGLNINFVHGDMREPAFEGQFDGAYCLFTSFGYFDDDTNLKTVQNLARALKPGGRLVLEIINRDYVVRDLPSRVWWEGDGCVVLEEVEFNYFSSRVLSHRSVVFDDGRQLEQDISVRAYSLHELGKLLHTAGFRVVEVSGGMHNRGRFFGCRSRDIVVVAERPMSRKSTNNGVGTPRTPR